MRLSLANKETSPFCLPLVFEKAESCQRRFLAHFGNPLLQLFLIICTSHMDVTLGDRRSVPDTSLDGDDW